MIFHLINANFLIYRFSRRVKFKNGNEDELISINVENLFNRHGLMEKTAFPDW